MQMPASVLLLRLENSYSPFKTHHVTDPLSAALQYGSMGAGPASGPNNRCLIVFIFTSQCCETQASPTFLFLRECGLLPLSLCHFIRHLSPASPAHMFGRPAGCRPDVPKFVNLIQGLVSAALWPANLCHILQHQLQHKEGTLLTICLTLTYVFPSTGS